MKRHHGLCLIILLLLISACTARATTPPITPTTESTPTATADGDIEPIPKPLHRPVPGSTTTVTVPLPIDDGGLLTKDPCGPPCFLGVVPDVTTYTEAIQILTDYQYLDSCKERDNTEEGGVQWIGCSSTFIVTAQAGELSRA